MDILANLKFLKIDSPDWKAKYVSGFSSNINYGTENFSCMVVFDRDGEIQQGDSVDCEISFLTHESHVGKLKKGMDFSLFSGNVAFAEGKIQYVSD